MPDDIKDIMQWLFHFSNKDGTIPSTWSHPILTKSPLHPIFRQLHTSTFNSHPSTASPQPLHCSPSANVDDPYMDHHVSILSESSAHLERIAGSLDRSGSSKRGFDKCTSILKETLLAAGSVDGNHPAADMSQKGRDIFSAKTDREAHLLLTNALHRAGYYYAKISPAQAKSICSGFWGYDGTNPGGISMLLFCPYSPADGYSLTKESLILHLKTTHSMDSLSLKQLTETDVVIPCTTEKVIDTLALSRGLWSLFFPDGLVERNLEYVLMWASRNKQTISRLAISDSQFTAKLLCCIDTRINKWIEMCSLNGPGTMESVNESIIDFTDIIDLLERGMFNFGPLPACILNLAQEDTTAPPSATPSKGPKNKRKRESNRVIENPRINPRWKLKQGEDWQRVFCTTEAVRCRPEGVCARFQIRGYCFENCRHPHTEVPGNRTADMDRHVDSCRQSTSRQA